MSEICKFFAGRSVFITGGSGFVGKQLVEKLLRSCPEIDKIFLLMRDKKGLTAQQRLRQTLASPVCFNGRISVVCTVYKLYTANSKYYQLKRLLDYFRLPTAKQKLMKQYNVICHVKTTNVKDVIHTYALY